MSPTDESPELDEHVEPAEIALSIHAVCEECTHTTGVARPPPWGDRFAGYVLFEMAPGRDGIPWYLCLRHWFDGLHPNDNRALGTGRVVETEADPAPLPVATQRPTKGDSHAKVPKQARKQATPNAKS